PQEVSLYDIESPSIEVILLRSFARFRRGGVLAAPQDRLDARDQLAAAEGFGQVIVGPPFQADHAIDLVTLGGEHDDWDAGLSPDAPAQRQPVLTRQHEVEEDEVDPAVGHGFPHAAAVRRDADPEAFLGQSAGNQIANLAMIIDDQDVRRVRHAKEYSRP